MAGVHPRDAQYSRRRYQPEGRQRLMDVQDVNVQVLVKTDQLPSRLLPSLHH
jgi:hypothetical protein